MTAVLGAPDASAVYRSLLAASGLPTEVPTPPRMPYRPEAELKRPDLKGEFVCATCKKTFCHAASLNRHRLNFHGGNHFCTICQDVIQPKETVRRHMSAHGYERIFTCGCCNWAFPDKKELHIHTSSMAKTNTPGSARAIATTSSANGEGPAIGVFKEPKKVRDARLAFKAAAAAAAAANAAALPTDAAELSAAAAAGQQPLSPPQTTLLPACTMPAALLPQGNVYAQLLQLMSVGAGPQNAWLQAFLANNLAAAARGNCGNQEMQQTMAQQQQQLTPLDMLAAANGAATSSGLPSTSRSEAQDTESDRALSPTHSPPSAASSDHHHHEAKPLDISSLLGGSSVVQFAAKTPSSMSPMTSGLSIDDDCSSSPSSSHSDSAHSPPSYEDKFSLNNNAAAMAAAAAAAAGCFQLQHSIAALISPDKGAKDSCSSSSSETEAASPEAARQTPSPSAESRKRGRTLDNIISSLVAKKCKEEVKEEIE
ncbi:hypothetical protein PENTCL1PPCAC_10564 [Pristionchus entomophagus]|uniref:C2H2-type domain-containing protein n=1 Tax=Pristionchus entomophagus TaxID=358040 RepID=A0AAV5T757_9BILA|nr:hypothetical protein PENTCL1PPCAC_10564 [Pristionchus entomophagus]